MTPKFNQNFWKWFGNSKVVDEKGNPLVVYHGTCDEEVFTEFKTESDTELGSHFAKDPEIAGEFTGHSVKALTKFPRALPWLCGRIYPCYLSVQNPLDVDTCDQGHWTVANVKGMLRDWEIGTESEIRKIHTPYAVKKHLSKHGYDGITYVNLFEGPESKIHSGDESQRSWIVFEPWQIKSVHNSGAWSPRTGNIMNPPQRFYTAEEVEQRVPGAFPQGGKYILKMILRPHIGVWDERDLESSDRRTLAYLRKIPTEKFDPIVVNLLPGGGYNTVDGFHRIWVAREREVKKILAFVRVRDYSGRKI